MSDFGDKTEAATPERRRKAREDGQFARSRDATQVAAASAVLFLIFAAFPPVFGQLKAFCQSCFSLTSNMTAVSHQALLTIVLLAVAPAGLAATAALGVGFAQAGMRPNLSLIIPKASRLSPMSHLKRLVSLKSMVLDTLMTLSRVAIVGTVTYLTVKESMPTLVVLVHTHHAVAASTAISVVASVAKKSGIALFLLSALDYAKSRWELEKGLRMTKQEVKDEHKKNEGDGKVKHRMLARGRERIKKAIRTQVKTADVIVTNPTHVSVALRYRSGEGAPIVLAKGYDEVALYIRKCAREFNVPIVEAPPLARALAKRVKIGRFVPRDLWSPVAEVLAFVYRIRKGIAAPSAPARGSHQPPG
jgi:flagellar biosynthetic protein FlhB